MPGVSFRTASTSGEMRRGFVEVLAADFDREPAVLLPPPESSRVSCWLPPEARVVMTTPGRPTSTWRRSVAI